MRSLHVVLLLGIFAATAFMIFSTAVNEPPAEEVKVFFQKVQSGDVRQILREFGDNTCHCAPKAGYIAYLQYEPNEDPTLAFMLGQKFQLGEITTKKLPYNGTKYIFPWDKPEDYAAFVRVSFEPDQAPYFLPLDTAYGVAIPQKELESFIADPQKNWWKALTVRLRTTLEPGLIKQPDPNAPLSEDDQKVAEMIKSGDLPKEWAAYMHPADPGPIESANGKVPISQFAASLPRLKSMLFGMKVVRRGAIQPWKIRKLAYDDPVLYVGSKEVPLKWTGPSQIETKKINAPEPPEDRAHRNETP